MFTWIVTFCTKTITKSFASPSKLSQLSSSYLRGVNVVDGSEGALPLAAAAPASIWIHLGLSAEVVGERRLGGRRRRRHVAAVVDLACAGIPE